MCNVCVIWSSACLNVVAVLKQAHVRAKAVICGRQLGQQLWREFIDVQRPLRKQEPVRIVGSEVSGEVQACRFGKVQEDQQQCLVSLLHPVLGSQVRRQELALAVGLGRWLSLPQLLPAAVRVCRPDRVIPGSPEAYALHLVALLLVSAGHLCKRVPSST